MKLVFVYGTLKSNHRNNVLLKDSTLINENAIVPGFKLLDVGFPIAIPCKDSSISGEVYDISGDNEDTTLASLDRLEAEGRMYDRKKVKTLDGMDLESDVEMYVGNSHFWRGDNLMECPKINNVYTWQR